MATKSLAIEAYTETGYPLEGAWVELTDSGLAGSTGANGGVIFEEVDYPWGGEYVRVSKEGFEAGDVVLDDGMDFYKVLLKMPVLILVEEEDEEEELEGLTDAFEPAATFTVMEIDIE